MDRIILVAILTAVIHLTDTLFYAVRLSGVKTRRLATAFSLYQLISLLAGVANMVQAPLLSAVVEQGINAGFPSYQDHLNRLQKDIRLIILAASGGTAGAAFLTPLAIFIFNRAIFLFERMGSLPRLLFSLLSPIRIFRICREVRRALAERRSFFAPRGSLKKGNFLSVKSFLGRSPLPLALFLTHILVIGIWTTGVLSALYAGALLPSYRSTASLLSGIVNGIAAVLAAFLIDPVTAVITDQALQGLREEKEIVYLSCWLILSRLLGTLFAQLIFLPAAHFVKIVALILAQASP
ncbi:MAG: DUF2837 family protein [Bacillota bacterium]|nr:DUF2837 family protein [Bacillota bacterium]